MSALLLLLTVPVTGMMLDKYWRRISGLRASTVLNFIIYSLTAYFALIGMAVTSLVFFIVGLYFYLLSFTFFTPLLNDLSTVENRGRVSGLGVLANYLGQIVGILITLPFSIGAISLFGGNLRAETLLPATILFFLCALPVLIWFKEDEKADSDFSIGMEFKKSFREMLGILSYKPVGLFLLTYFLFNDAVLTAVNNFSVFLEQVWQITDTEKSMILLGILITSAIGGYVGGIIADAIGHAKMQMTILIGWIVILPAIALTTNYVGFLIAVVLMGFWLGSSWSTARTFIGDISLEGKHNSTFAYFGLTERVSALLGPVVWGGIATGLYSVGSDRYRIAALTMVVFVALAVFFFRKVLKEIR